MNKILAIVCLLVLVSVGVGCQSGRAKATSERPVPPPYVLGQEPEKRVIGNSGREYRRHVEDLQKSRLAHEKRMVDMEYQAREREWARTNGLLATPPPQPPPVQNHTPVALPAQTLPPTTYYEPQPVYVPDPTVQVVGGVYVRQQPSWDGTPLYGPTREIRHFPAGGGQRTIRYGNSRVVLSCPPAPRVVGPAPERCVVPAPGRTGVQPGVRPVVGPPDRSVIGAPNRGVVSAGYRQVVGPANRTVVGAPSRQVVGASGRSVAQSPGRAIVSAPPRTVVRGR